MLNKFFARISFFLFVIFSIIIFTTCSFFNKPMLDELKKYTEEVVFMKYELNQTTRTDKDDYLCVSSAEDLIIDYYISNPQLYSFGGNSISKNMAENYAIVENNSNGVDHDAAVDQNMHVEQIDPNLVRVTISASYLTQIDGVKAGYGEDAYSNTKGKGDIIPSVTLIESGSGRKFTSPKIKLACNSTPMPVRNLTMFRQSTDGDKYTYVLCFNMPDLSGIHKDIVELSVTSNRDSFDSISIPVEPDINTSDYPGINAVLTEGFENVDSTTMGNLIHVTGNPEEVVTWQGEELPRALYFDTGYIAKDTENVSFTITLTDYEGFSSSATVSVNAIQLDVPTTNVTYTTPPDPDNSYEGVGSIDTNIETGWGTIKITAPTSKAKVHYIASNSTGTVVYSGSGTGIVNAKLPGGMWTIETWAQQSGYLDSLPLEVEVAVKDKYMTTAYVVGNGAKYLAMPNTSDTYAGQMGSKALPFTSINEALSAINAANLTEMGFDQNNTVPFTIMIDGIIEPTSQLGDGWFIGIDNQYNNLSNRPITICGYKNTAIIDAKQKAGVLNIVSSDITLKDIIITGGNKTGTTGGGGVYVDGGTLTLEAGAVITGNKAKLEEGSDSGGGGVCVENSGKLVLNSGSEISGNEANNGGGVYIFGYSNEMLTMNGGVIKNNKANENGGGVYSNNSVGGTGDLIQGGSITGNTAKFGGGVFVGQSCCPEISNISITNNIGDGVYLEGYSGYTAQPSFSGKVIINNNKDSTGKPKNLVFGDNFSLYSIGGLVNGSKIGITKPSDVDAPFTFASGWEGIPWETIFFADEEGYEITHSSSTNSLNVVKIITILPYSYSYGETISVPKNTNTPFSFEAFLSDGTEVTDLSEWFIIAQNGSTVVDNEVNFELCNKNTETLTVKCIYNGVDYTQDFKVHLL